MADALAGIARICGKHRLQVANIFHAGDGNLHPLILYDANNEEEKRRAEHAGEEILTLCVELGGCLTGEHGVGSDKVEYMPEAFDPPSLELMCEVRRVFDPGARANPGKVFPLHTCREWRQRGVA